MRYTNLHTHTEFCDGKGDVESFCLAAYKKGFAALGFSAHAPIAKKTGIISDWHLPENRLEEYIDAVKTAQRSWEGKLPVYLGLEVDYIKGLMGPGDRDLQELGLDYLIGSVHYVISPRSGEPFAVDSSGEEFAADMERRLDGDGEALVELYWDALEDMIRTGGFDILGHMDLIKKNNPNHEWFPMESDGYRRRIRQAAVQAGRSGVVAEVNTGGLIRGKTRDLYPSQELLLLLQAEGVPVTISSDAHEPAHLGGHYETARQELIRAGYGTIVFFEGKKDGKTVWSEEYL
jgi:histidinol-phosphatase (PHP family)